MELANWFKVKSNFITRKKLNWEAIKLAFEKYISFSKFIHVNLKKFCNILQLSFRIVQTWCVYSIACSLKYYITIIYHILIKKNFNGT